MAVVTSSPWENEVIGTRNDVAQQIMDDTSLTLEDALQIGMDEVSQLVTDPEITIE